MKTPNFPSEETGSTEAYKWLLKLFIAAITLAPLFAIAPYVLKQSDAKPRCDDLERSYMLAEMNSTPDREQLRQEFLAKCEKKLEVKQ